MAMANLHSDLAAVPVSVDGAANCVLTTVPDGAVDSESSAHADELVLLSCQYLLRRPASPQRPSQTYAHTAFDSTPDPPPTLPSSLTQHTHCACHGGGS